MKTNRLFHPLMIAVLFLVTPFGALNVAHGQSDLADEDRATLLFDIRMGQMRDGDFMKSMKEKIDEMKEMMPTPEEVDLEKLDRIFGAMSMPDSLEDFQEVQFSRPEGLEFFVRMEFSESSAADTMYTDMEEGSETEEIDGKTFLVSPDGDDILAHRVDDTTLEMGTRKYLMQSTRRLFTKGLDAAFKKTPDHGIRLVVDLASESDLVSELMAEASANAPDPTSATLINLIDNASDLRISMDFDSKNLLSIAAKGVNEGEAEELQGGLDGLLGMAKFAGMNAVGQIPDPDLAEMAKGVLENLKATRDGLEVKIDIARPEKLKKAVEMGLDMIPMLMMGGPPSPDDF